MERTLGFYPFFVALISVIAICGICLINMYLLARHKSNHVTICVHVFSLFAVFSMIFHMMQTAVFVHPMAENYHLLSVIFFFLAGGTLFIGIIFALLFEQQHSLTNLPHSIPDALKDIEDVVFVIDGEGTILHINHPEKYHAFLGNISTFEELHAFLKERCNLSRESLQSLSNLAENQVCELYFDWMETNVIFKVSPIVFNGSCLASTAVLQDITPMKNIEKQLQKQNEALVIANEKLSKYIIAAGALEGEKERLEILSQVQATVIRDIEEILLSIRSVKLHCFQDGSYQISMKEFAAQLRQIYQKVRNTVGKIAGKEGKA